MNELARCDGSDISILFKFLILQLKFSLDVNETRRSKGDFRETGEHRTFCGKGCQLLCLRRWLPHRMLGLAIARYSSFSKGARS